MNYAEARKIVTAEGYVPVRKVGAPKHPWDVDHEDRMKRNGWGVEKGWKGWGDGLTKRTLDEMQLIRYIYYHFGCQPAPGERAKYIRKSNVYK